MKLNRRAFTALAGASMTALKAGAAHAQTADPSQLGTTLTPFGSEKAGNADGSIPAWTGGYKTLPEGWQPGDYMPDFFADDQPVAIIDSSNMSQYADKLTDGIQAMMTKYGFSIKVYPTRRTHSVPDSVAAYIAQNVTNARLIDPANPQYGFTGGFGGYPFPIPDTSNPLAAGAQIILNHNCHWAGYATVQTNYAYVVNNGQLVLTYRTNIKYDYPYYYRKDLPTVSQRLLSDFNEPGYLNGEEVVVWYHTDNESQDSWELLNGQGRVRRAPELSFDTPSSFEDGICNNDEFFGFNSQIDEYDWKYLGKQELYIPYNNNAMYLLPAEQVLLSKFANPDVIRWELHRVWVVEATLHPGKRNVLARRKFYIDEDTWTIGVTDAWDAGGHLYRSNHVYNWLRPEMPGLLFGNNSVYNLQTGDYCLPNGCYDEKARPSLKFVESWPDATFDPQNMAATAQY